MSRIGKQPIIIPDGAELAIDGQTVHAKGPKGELTQSLVRGLKLAIDDKQAKLVLIGKTPQAAKSWGLMRTLIDNMLVGVTRGFEKSLEINGVGYRANVSGQSVNLSLGFSHPIDFKLPAGVEAKVEKNIVTIMGADKQLVGQVAADIRSLRKPEPYKGKGIKYSGERIRRKAGKAAVKG